jgi:cytochrome c554/c'-like protein
MLAHRDSDAHGFLGRDSSVCRDDCPRPAGAALTDRIEKGPTMLARPIRPRWLAPLFVLALGVPAAYAQKPQMLGPSQCINCHDHDPEKAWFEKQDGPPPNGHINALNQMETPKSAQFAKAIGLADAYDVKGPCVRCHATVFKGDANAGVSCESCHGPGSAYLEPHKEKGSYAKAVSLGMSDVVGKPQTWVQTCLGCHVMDDKKLVDAGHPSGENFDIAKAFPIVGKHFKKQPDPEMVVKLGNGAKIVLISQRDGVAPPKEALALAPNPEPPPIDAPIPAMPAAILTLPPAPPPPPRPARAPQAPAATTTAPAASTTTSAAEPAPATTTAPTTSSVEPTTTSVPEPPPAGVPTIWIVLGVLAVAVIAILAFLLGRKKG